MAKKVLIVGAGVGGLAVATRLAHRGCSVEIWEKNPAPGGKLQEIHRDGFRWDTGPSLLTMPEVLHDLFTAADARLEDFLQLERLENTCRYFWRDGTVIDEDAAFWQRPEVARFLDYARGIYELAGEAYLHYAPGDFWRAFHWRSLPKLRHLPKIVTLQTLAQKVNHFFTDPHLRQLFHRFATYNGSSPYRTPATFNIIPFVEAHFGGWYVRGGMARLAEALTRLAESRGVVIHYGTEVSRYEQGEAAARDGRRARPDVLICNQDVLAAQRSWLAETWTPSQHRAFQKPALSTSGFILFLGVKKRFPQLRHHNLFFGQDYPGEFRAIHDEGRLPDDPSIYLAITARSDPGHAPSGQDNYFVLINAPSLPPAAALTPEESQRYADRVVEKLEHHGLTGLRREIVSHSLFTSRDFATRDLSGDGSLYGWASHSIRTALFRPPLRHSHLRNLYFVGGTTHPGGGIPLVLLSAKIVAEKIAP